MFGVFREIEWGYESSLEAPFGCCPPPPPHPNTPQGLSICFALSLGGLLSFTHRSMSNGMNGPVTPTAVQLTRLMLLGMPPIAAVGTAMLPSGMVLYFLANTMCLVTQAALLDSPQVRRKLGIPVLTDEVQPTNPYVGPAPGGQMP